MEDNKIINTTEEQEQTIERAVLAFLLTKELITPVEAKRIARDLNIVNINVDVTSNMSDVCNRRYSLNE